MNQADIGRWLIYALGAVTAVDAFLGRLRSIGKSLSDTRSLLRGLPGGRRRAVAGALTRLDTGHTLATFARELGPPTSAARADARLWHTFQFPFATITAGVDADNIVTRYSVTTRSRKFRPTVNLTPDAEPPLIVRLGVSTLASAGDPDRIGGYLAAASVGYRERHYRGRPGGFRHFVLANDMYGVPSMGPAMVEALRELELLDKPNVDELLGWPALQEARRSTLINSYGVLGVSESADDWE